MEKQQGCSANRKHPHCLLMLLRDVSWAKSHWMAKLFSSA